MNLPPNIKVIIKLLSTDKHLVAECESCSEVFRLSEANLFYGQNFSNKALEYIQNQKVAIREAKEQFTKIKEKATIGAAKKSTEVNFGKVLEKVAPALEGFPFSRNDCRPLFEPIDYLVFKGWNQNGKVDELCFVDIKTGNSQLNQHQKQIREAVEKGKVELQVY